MSFSSVCQIHVIGIKANAKLRLPALEVGGIIDNEFSSAIMFYVVLLLLLYSF